MITPDQWARVMTLDNRRCRWPGCGAPAVELAHLHSRGMGGRPSADEDRNLMAACYRHARYTDGQPHGGQAQYREAIRGLIGRDPGPGTAWLVAERLFAAVAEGRERDGLQPRHLVH